MLKHLVQPVEDFRSPPRFLDEAEQLQLIQSVESSGDLQNIVAIRLMIECGLRVVELCALKWKDVVIVDGRAMLSLSAPPRRSFPKRHIPLNEKTHEELVSLRQTQMSNLTSHVLTGRTRPISRRGIEVLVARHSKTAGLRNVTAKTLRHSFILNHVDEGVDLDLLTMLIGRGVADFTSRYGPLTLRRWPTPRPKLK
jgi:integrase